MKHKIILCSDLESIPKIVNMYMQILKNLKKIQNTKHFWSQAFQIKDNQPIVDIWQLTVEFYYFLTVIVFNNNFLIQIKTEICTFLGGLFLIKVYSSGENQRNSRENSREKRKCENVLKSVSNQFAQGRIPGPLCLQSLLTMVLAGSWPPSITLFILASQRLGLKPFVPGSKGPVRWYKCFPFRAAERLWATEPAWSQWRVCLLLPSLCQPRSQFTNVYRWVLLGPCTLQSSFLPVGYY